MNQCLFPISHAPKKKIAVFKIPLIVFFLFSFFYSVGQTGIQWKCGSDIMRQKNFNENLRTKHKNDSIENILLLSAQQYLQQKKLGGGMLPSPMQIYTIPVVVHIIHNNGPENIPDAQVISGIQHLNDAYRNVGVYDPTTGVDVEIEFCLAKQNENGNFTTGINRVVSTLTNMTSETDDITLKNLTHWDPTKYMNIWIVNGISSLAMGAGVAGYAYFPSSHGQPEDGLVVEANYFGFSANNSKVAVHEVGHYLGLYHTFEGGCSNNNCLTDGDKVSDTPPDASTSPVSCGSTINTCTTDDDDLSVNNPFRPVSNGGAGDQNDMFINYMDYSSQACQTAFTPGQKNRMITSLTGIRNSLLLSYSCSPPCLNAITASFSANASSITLGATVSFTNSSSGATGYTWQLDGTTFSSSTNASYTFNSEGIYLVKLIASNNEMSCTKEFTVTIIVTCSAAASFSVSPANISSGDNVTFTNTSTGATSYIWYIDGIAQGSAANFNYTFPTTGGFMVSLMATNGACSTTFYQYISVGICTGKEGNIWYFGNNAGIDFSSGSPVALTNSVMNQSEGCSSISDDSGNLLFYTNGFNVWNSNHIIMPNGDSLFGDCWLGLGSSTQAALIIQKPRSSNLYYIFTASPGEAYDQTFLYDYFGDGYSVVDMSLQGGLGDVVVKNVPLFAINSEKLTAVKHCNAKDVWVIGHDWGSNGFYAYLLDSMGVNTTPVISYVGTVIDSAAGAGTATTHGQLKASPNGDKLAMAIQQMQLFEFFDFDNSTGVVSNPYTYSSPGNYCYGVEFSPDGTKVYCGDNPYLYQFNLEAGTSIDIINSATILSSSCNLNSMQLAPNGKVYISEYGSQYLSAINNPNAIGLTCGFIPNDVYLGGKTCRMGLPNFSSTTFYKGEVKIIGADSVCTGNYTYSIKGCFSNVIWSLSGQGGIQVTTQNSITCHFDSAGNNILIAEATGSCGIKRDTLIITVLSSPAIELGADTVICQGDIILLNAGTGYNSYLWQNGSTNQTYTVNTAGQYKVTVSNSYGCSASDSININLAVPLNTLNLGSDINSCNGGINLLDAGSGFTSYEWQDGSTNQTYTVYMPGKYWVTVSTCEGVTSDTINVSWQSNIPFSIMQEGDLCAGQSVTLNGNPTNLASYIWDDGTFNYTRDVLTPGTYWLIATDANGCYDQDSVDVLLSDCNCVIAVPTAFSPNNDGHNDLFILHGFENCVTAFSFVIFDRWGEKVFETENPATSWDGVYKGKTLNSAVFVYYINATLNSGEKVTKKGNISLIR